MTTTCSGSLYTCNSSCYTNSSKVIFNPLFPKSLSPIFPKHKGCSPPQFPLSLSFSRPILTKALSSSDRNNNSISAKKEEKAVEEEEVEEELPWIQEKALDLVEFTGSVTQAIPGPRVGRSSLPWMLAVPLAYLGITFVIAFVKTVRKFNSPRQKRRQLDQNVDPLETTGYSISVRNERRRLVGTLIFVSIFLLVWWKWENSSMVYDRPIDLPLKLEQSNILGTYVLVHHKDDLVQVNKNAMLCKSIDELFEKGMNEVDPSAINGLMQQTGFGMEDILRKYIRYVLNEKPFNPDLVADLIQLRKKTMLDDSQVASILNDISRRIVKEKGPVVMDMSGYSEKGFKRKLAVQALFGKVYYLSELPEFCSKDSSLTVKEIFGVTDEDAEKLRVHTVSEAGDMDSLEKKMIDGSDEPEDTNDHESSDDAS